MYGCDMMIPVEALLEEIDGVVHVAPCHIANMAGQPLGNDGRVPAGGRLDAVFTGLCVALDGLVAGRNCQHLQLLESKIGRHTSG